jgi:hypothetical protein
VSNERSNERDSVTSSEGNGAAMFDFGPDVERPETGPQAALPPWMIDRARATHAAALDDRPRAGQTIAARLAGAAAEPVPAAAEVHEDVTPEPVVVPEFARIVPAPRKRRKPVPAERLVVAAPAVVDGSGLVAISPSDELVEDVENIDAIDAIVGGRITSSSVNGNGARLVRALDGCGV